jgi:Flp pilus assembly protein TadG
MNIFRKFGSTEVAGRFWHRMVLRRSDRRGAIALIYAIALPAMLGLVGVAVDFGNASLANLQLKTAADSAALLATTTASNAYLAGSSDANAVTAGITAATGRFSAQTGNLALVGKPTMSVTFASSNGGQFQASATYSAAIATSFMKYVGFASIAVAGSSSSQLSTNSFASISVLMDASMSMLIAADQSNINAMETATTSYKMPKDAPSNAGGTCAFACHWSTASPEAAPTFPSDYYALALQKNIKLRLNVLQDAVSSMIDTILALNNVKTFSIGLSTFNSTWNQIYPPLPTTVYTTNNIAGAKAYVQKIQPDINTCANDSSCPETYFTNAIAKLAAVTATSGNGATAASPQKFVFIVTDGVVDDVEGSKGRVVGPVSPTMNPKTLLPTDCQPLKDKGVTVMVLYTTYVPIPENDYYVQHVQPYNTGNPTTIAANLSACATSPSYYFEASDAADIANQMNKMFLLVQQTQSHLIN